LAKIFHAGTKRKVASITSDDDDDDDNNNKDIKPTISARTKTKKPRTNNTGGLKPSSPEITMYVIALLLDSYDGNMRHMVAERFGVTPSQLSNVSLTL
jgi:hypothetical protein